MPGRGGPDKLLIVSHVVHFQFGQQLFAYGPYAREIDMWADLFRQVVIAAPCREAIPERDCAAFTRSNISVVPQPETGGTAWRAKVAQALAVPRLLWRLSAAMRQADAIHVRSPGNLGLLGILLAPLHSRYLVAKFAGQWNGSAGETWSVRLQKALLRSRWWRGPVTVYGLWPGQPRHVVPFFTSSLTAEHLERARAAVASKQIGVPLRILFVGRLSAPKNVDVLLEAVAALRRQGMSLECTIIGDGPERRMLEARARSLQVTDIVTFTGALDLERVVTFYEQGDVLVLASDSEGWPKAIAEGMAFGLICVGANRGFVVEMLGDRRGILVPPQDVERLAEAIGRIAEHAREYDTMRRDAAQWAQRYSLADVREALRELLREWWGVTLRPPPRLA